MSYWRELFLSLSISSDSSDTSDTYRKTEVSEASPSMTHRGQVEGKVASQGRTRTVSGVSIEIAAETQGK
jgi:hypothetical protein